MSSSISKSEHYKVRYLEMRRGNPELLDKQIAYELGIKPNYLSELKRGWKLTESTTISVPVDGEVSEKVLEVLGVNSNKDTEDELLTEIVRLQRDSEGIRDVSNDELIPMRNRLMEEYMVLNLSRRKQQELLHGKVVSKVESILNKEYHTTEDKELLSVMAVLMKGLSS